MTISRIASGSLSRFVSRLWATPAAMPSRLDRHERVLPSGSMHLVLRLDRSPLVLLREGAPAVIGPDVVGGIRTGGYDKRLDQAGPSVGAMLRAGAGPALFGIPADEMRGRHVALDEIWPTREVTMLLERLVASPDSGQRLEIFERALSHRVRDGAPVDPLVGFALAGLRRHRGVLDLARDAGLSHTAFSRRFGRTVGVGPKSFQRLLRFNRALETLHRAATPDLAQIAATAGFADQAHFCREFRYFSGMTPMDYRRRRGPAARHVDLEGFDFLQDSAKASS